MGNKNAWETVSESEIGTERTGPADHNIFVSKFGDKIERINSNSGHFQANGVFEPTQVESAHTETRHRGNGHYLGNTPRVPNCSIDYQKDFKQSTREPNHIFVWTDTPVEDLQPKLFGEIPNTGLRSSCETTFTSQLCSEENRQILHYSANFVANTNADQNSKRAISNEQAKKSISLKPNHNNRLSCLEKAQLLSSNQRWRLYSKKKRAGNS